VCSNDLVLAVSGFCTGASVSANLLVTLVCCACTVSEDCCTWLGEW